MAPRSVASGIAPDGATRWLAGSLDGARRLGSHRTGYSLAIGGWPLALYRQPMASDRLRQLRRPGRLARRRALVRCGHRPRLRSPPASLGERTAGHAAGPLAHAFHGTCLLPSPGRLARRWLPCAWPHVLPLCCWRCPHAQGGRLAAWVVRGGLGCAARLWGMVGWGWVAGMMMWLGGLGCWPRARSADNATFGKLRSFRSTLENDQSHPIGWLGPSGRSSPRVRRVGCGVVRRLVA